MLERMVLPRKNRENRIEEPFDLPAFRQEVEGLVKTGKLAEFLGELGPVSVDDLDDLKRRYASTIIQLDRLRPMLAAADVLDPSDENGWSIKETLGHLIDTDRDIWWPRIELLLHEDRPQLKEIDQQRLLVEHDWKSQSLEYILAQFVRARWGYAMRLHSLSAEEFDRRGTHEVLGEVSILRITQILVAHDEHYLGKIRRMIQNPPLDGQAEGNF